MKQSGWRKPTPGLCEANVLAREGECTDVTKNRAMLAVRRVAPAIGLKPGDLMLIDILVMFTRPGDWGQGSRPLVWPSNEYLVEITGLSLSAIKRKLRKLAEKGLIAYRDSSNGKRWGRRDAAGCITEAYGFDLSPLAARALEFESLHAALSAKRDLVRKLKRRITILRRSVLAILESQFSQTASAIWGRLRDRYERLVASLGRGKRSAMDLEVRADDFAALLRDAEDCLQDIQPAKVAARSANSCTKTEKEREMDPTGCVSDPHIQPTNESQFVERNCIEKAAFTDRKVQNKPDIKSADQFDEATSRTRLISNVRKDNAMQPLNERPGQHLTLETVMYACPVFADLAHNMGEYVRNWREMLAVADKVRPLIGISTDVWESAKVVMGPQAAAAALALITDKLSEGTLSSPGGYLRGLCRKAQNGELNLSRSLFGRIGQRQQTDKG